MPFVKGDPNINRNGRPTNPEVKLLRNALEIEGIKRGITFWQEVANQAFRDKTIMVAVLRKFVPDTSEMTSEMTLDGQNLMQSVININSNGKTQPFLNRLEKQEKTLDTQLPTQR